MSDVYRTIPYPDPAYRPDEPAQSEVRDFAKRKDRYLKQAFGAMAAAFVFAVVLGFAHFVTAALVGILVFITLFLVAIGVLFSTPRNRVCAKCSGRLETVWTQVSGGFAAEYRICRNCSLFRYMFRTSRR